MQLSILDQAPISAGMTAQDALHASTELARIGDRLGYTRYWMAEHHDLSGLACPSPDVMLGIIGAKTTSIRIGSGAVLLPHYKPFRVAETYNLLATLYPRRVDLGIGRAPGGSAEVTMALSDNFLENVRKMPDMLDDLLRFLNDDFPKDHMYAKIRPSPVPKSSPNPWLLGTSEKSAVLAAQKGMAYTFGHFMSNQDGPSIVRKYVNGFSKKYELRKPKVIVTISVICAETTEEAEKLALSGQLWSVKRAKGEDIGIPTVEEAKNYSYTADDLALIKKAKNKMIIGNPKEVKLQLEEIQKTYDVNELMIVTITHSTKAKLKSYELIAKEILSN
ncbi:LLM class flavin-dependent oxidoreductase [Virgibacillus necropolis]|uniref:LLM class flavin-dependent oxidoreductase n=1 Tax=Virgibacillus necropolis TaxID=163877 RepID=A0A221MI60_9BACI|nr:LLM class flavin-dependent oxidoreductase [Virgibacillus necropolis]ASN07324.1 LLM class flavin-dependent oxidoreductase [Virgibacillus necropolis]